MKEWLMNNGITHIAMESTGVYWKPIFNILEDSFEILLVNARHLKKCTRQENRQGGQPLDLQVTFKWFIKREFCST